MSFVSRDLNTFLEPGKEKPVMEDSRKIVLSKTYPVFFKAKPVLHNY